MSIGAVVVALGAGGVGIAQAAGGESSEPVTGPQAERATQAALGVVGRADVVDVGVERADGGGWDVTVVRRVEELGPWGTGLHTRSDVDVQLDRGFQVVGTPTD
jgi:hypothetical protein